MCQMKHKRLISLVLAIMLIALNVIGANADYGMSTALEEADHNTGLNAFDSSFIPDDFFENSSDIVPFATYYETESNNTMSTADTII